jgi:heat shock protein HtpX
MSKYFSAGLVLLYVIMTISCFLLVLVLSGVRISDTAGWLIMTAWVVFCFCSAYFLTGLYFFFGFRLRKPMAAEAEKLEPAFREVAERAGVKKKVKLRIDESKEWNAFAVGTRTIVVSKKMLADLTEDELKGTLAHELGHLVSFDTIVVAAYVEAGRLPGMMGYIFRMIMSAIGLSLSFGLAGILVLGVVFYLLHLLQAIIAILLFVMLFALLNRIFHFLSLLLMRLTEYRQDAFAQKLGYGKGLRDTLEKIAYKGEQYVNPYFIVFKSTHPIIYNRIRRLERMEKLERELATGAH